jgi:glycosyltransferase involved in cell wall biosynthesis
MSEPSSDLAVVIPAFRSKYLGEALASLAAQTDRAFTVYVCDDASPERLDEVVANYSKCLDLRYVRFETNLGGKDLVGQWERSVRCTGKEPWIWLFSDDDIAEDDCVRSFRQSVAGSSSPCDLWRFDLTFIDAEGGTFLRAPPHPAFETAAAFFEAYITCQDRRQWRAADHIFSRAVYERSGGFVSFPRAIYSDHATWLKFSLTTGVRTVPGPRVRWRSYGGNVTTAAYHAKTHVTSALYAFSEWLREYADNLQLSPRDYYRELLRDHFFVSIAMLTYDRDLFTQSLAYANHHWPDRRLRNLQVSLRNYVRDLARATPGIRRLQGFSLRPQDRTPATN